VNIQNLPRIPLAFLPTPIEELRALSSILKGPRIFMKRDDQTGLAFGGNKVRKLEFLVADALRQQADTIITLGAAQSNHCRQTAAAAARAGLRCELVLGGTEPDIPDGNLLLDRLFGATIHWSSMEHRVERMQQVVMELKEKGRRPYPIPYGGSNAVGATGFAAAMQEVMTQLATMQLHVDAILVASSSGGTQAGLVAGARATGFKGSIIGISIDKGERGEERYETELAALANQIAERIGLHADFSDGDFTVNYQYLGGGYGVVGALEREAIRLLARTEGILLDPVYTGRAMGAFTNMIRKGAFSSGQSLLFWHTGGAPALFHYAMDLVQSH
jgi:D-cysteine desulfhydrase family pyridoxal phosphate-dependent enzyme